MARHERLVGYGCFVLHDEQRLHQLLGLAHRGAHVFELLRLGPISFEPSNR